ncbi:MAG: RIO1 family regulatory kinase/ATPase [Candidatus Thorarchaeota archaeon]
MKENSIEISEKETHTSELEKFECLSTTDIENADRIELPKIKGVIRTVRAVERDPKEVITRFDNKIFDAGFMTMHTQEITYKLLREELIKTRYITDLVSEVNAGKEASIYIAHLHGTPLIVKSFRHQLTSHNSAKGNPQIRAAAIANREFYLLSIAYNSGLNVPTPAKQINNTIIMRFIGKDWEPAPQLRNAKLTNPEQFFDDLIEQIWIMYNKSKLIHGDLSEYNILVQDDKPIIIDLPQAIDMSLLAMGTTENMKENLQVLHKDLFTVCKYFEKEYRIHSNLQEIYEYIVGKDAHPEKVDFTLEEIEAKFFTHGNKL